MAQGQPKADTTNLEKEAERDLHPVTADKEKLRSSGKDIHQVNPPIVSVNPSSGNPKEEAKDDFLIIDDANRFAEGKREHVSRYPYADLDIGQGVFIPATESVTTDMLVERLHKDIYQTRAQFSEVERDEDGDEILEMLCVLTRKRNEDGTIQLENGKPVVGANMVQRPKLVAPHMFIVRPVVKDYDLNDGTKAPSDGVMVIRTM